MENVIEVRKPRYTFIQRIKLKIYGYSRKQEKWRNNLPNDGDMITLTWLPNPRNNPFEPNCYIGSKGIVEDMDKLNGDFTLRLESGSSLFCINSNFNYIKH